MRKPIIYAFCTFVFGSPVISFAVNEELLDVELASARYCEYPDELARQMEEQGTYHIELKKGWKVLPKKTSYSDYVSGWVLDDSGTPRLSYRGKTAIYESYLYAECISESEGQELKAKNYKSDKNQELEGEAYRDLNAIMGDEVFNRFAIQLSGLLYDDFCYRGYGSWMSAQVTPVLNWHQGLSDKENEVLKSFLTEKFKETEAAKRLRNFIEMFIANGDLAIIQNMCSEMDVGAFATMHGVETESNLYLKWKELRKTVTIQHP